MPRIIRSEACIFDDVEAAKRLRKLAEDVGFFIRVLFNDSFGIYRFTVLSRDDNVLDGEPKLSEKCQ